jgi:type II secretory pathway pseudopilin PulG
MADRTVISEFPAPGTTKWERGYTLAAALTLLAIMAIFLTLALPLWSRVKQRDNEEELIFRGKEYMEAIGRYQQKFGALPPDLETLQKLKMIRRLYPDPMTKSGKWKLIHPGDLSPVTGQAGQIGGGKTSDIPTAGQTQEEFEQQQAQSEEEADNAEGDEEKEVETIGPIIGVVSRSKKKSMKTYNNATSYNKWRFVWGEQQLQQQLQQQQQQQQQLQRQQGATTPTTRSGQQQGGTDKDDGSSD